MGVVSCVKLLLLLLLLLLKTTIIKIMMLINLTVIKNGHWKFTGATELRNQSEVSSKLS